MEDSALPVMEVQDIADLQGSSMEIQTLEESSGGTRKQGHVQKRGSGRKVDHISTRKHSEDRVGLVSENSKKRKREGTQEGGVDAQKPKKRKKDQGVSQPEIDEQKPLKGETQQRFILFLGMFLDMYPFTIPTSITTSR